MAEKETVTITDNRTGNKVDLPIKTGTHGPDVFDIRSMYSNLGMFTYDRGSFRLLPAAVSSPISMAMKVYCCIVVIPSSSWQKRVVILKSAICC